MALVTVQRSPSPNASAEGEEGDVVDASESSVKSPRQRRNSRSALKKLRKLFNTVRFVTKLKPCFSENYFTVKGAALILPQSDFEAAYNRKPTKHHGGDEIQGHLQAMFSLLRPQDTIKVAVKLEGNHTRYLAVVSCIGRQDTEESVILGVDIVEKADIGLIIPLWAHTQLKLDGDGGFSITADNNIHCFKPVSVQAMWSALQSLNKVVTIANKGLYLPRGLTHTWVGYYEAKLTTNATRISEWNKTSDIDNSYRTPDMSPGHTTEKPTKDRASVGSTYEEMTSEETLYKTIKTELKNVMMSVDLEEVTCLFLRKSVEEKMGMDLKEHRSFIDKEMMAILGQMDAPSLITDYLYLGSEWNASNLEELQSNGVNYILNISREIDNFFPGILHYCNVREWDVEESNLQKYWDDTYKFIEKAKKKGGKTLVHCKMGISRSASTVIAFLMKEERWSLQEAYEFCRAKRSIINPNAGFWKQLEEYEGILRANWNRGVFNRASDPPVLASPDEKDEAAVGAQYFQTPEEFLSMKFGPGTGEGFIHTEQDIDMASRSADSTEDSVPDNLSPDGITRPKRSHRKRSEKSASESGDITGLSSDSSDFSTDSEDLSTTDEDEDDNDGRTFKPISVPGVEIDLPSDEEEDRRKAGKPGRRSKSESDQASVSAEEGLMLRVEGRGPSCSRDVSREGSQSRIRPDESWIKEIEDEEEGEGEGEDGEGNTAEAAAADKESLDAQDTGEAKEDTSDKSDDTENTEGSRSKWYVDAEETEAVTEAGPTEMETVDDQKELDKEADPYIRENIPWNPGTVKKQKDDIEGKFGGVSDKKDKADSDNVKVINSDEETSPQAQPEIKVDLAAEAAMSCEMGDSGDTGEAMCVDPDEEKRDVDRSKESLYAREEIDLPEGIVRKTTQEIEQRNKLFVETPKKKIQRSSSMNSLRVTPKARDRDNERRKTCIAILSPTSPVEPEKPQLDVYKDADTTILDADQTDTTLTDLGVGEAVQCGACGEGDGEGKVEALSGATVKVYKYMGEELTVQEGMVRKQKMDIEHNVWKPSNSEDDETSQEQIPALETVSTEASVNINQAAPSCLTGSDNPEGVLDSGVPQSDSDTKEEDDRCSSIDSAHIQSVDIIKATLGRNDCKAEGSGAQTTTRKPSLNKQESRFDSETLELIREIGSALLNSPAKAKTEQQEEDEGPPQGKGLVSHFVKQIEASSGIEKKRARKEIIVIDKDSEESTTECRASDQPPRIYGLPCASPSDKTDRAKSQNDSTVSKRNSFSKSKQCDSGPLPLPVETSSNSAKLSPMLRTSSRSPQPGGPLGTNTDDKVLKTCVSREEKISPSVLEERLDCGDAGVGVGDSPSLSDTRSDSGNLSSQDEASAEACSVRNLVGKFEHNDSSSGKSTPVFGMSNLSSPSSTTQFFPGAKSDMEVSDSDKSSPQGAKSPASGSDTGSTITQKTLQHRMSEPVIKLSDKSLNLFTKTLAEGTSSFDQDVLSEESESADSAISEGGLSEGSVVRPKSAGQSHRQGKGRRSDSRRSHLRHSHTLPHSESGAGDQFSWEGRRARKLYGRTHPLAKLEDQSFMDNLRSNPFYNTM